MKRVIYVFAALLVFLITENNASCQGSKLTDNVLTAKEVKDGWKLLFDGKTTEGWMNAKSRSFPKAGWVISDGAFRITPESGSGGDIVTTTKYRDFELSIDFMYGKGANSGIKYFVDTDINNGALASIGCEYQIIDDKNYTEGILDIKGRQNLAALYDIIAPVNVVDNGADHWNTAKIIVRGSQVQQWLNGKKTVDYERGTQAWRDMVALTKFKTSPGFGEVTEGRILLQEHGGIASFKNIKIRAIK
jgi:hypothetical protein